MKLAIEYDDKHERPRAVLEGESAEEDDQLRQLVSFPTVTFAVVVDGGEEEVEVSQ